MMPLPTLPVDSASSCSSPAPRSEMPGEVRWGGISSANRGTSEEDMEKAIRLRHLLHLRFRIGDCHEVASDFHCTHSLPRALKKILFEDVRFERAARLAGNDKERLRNIDLMLERLHLRGIGRIEHVQDREVSDSAERLAQDFRTQA